MQCQRSGMPAGCYPDTMVKVWLLRPECFWPLTFSSAAFCRMHSGKLVFSFCAFKIYSNKTIQVLSLNKMRVFLPPSESSIHPVRNPVEGCLSLTLISSHLPRSQWEGKALGVDKWEVTNAPSEIRIICELYDRVLLNLKTLALTKQKGPLFSEGGVRVCSFLWRGWLSGNSAFQVRVSSTCSSLPRLRTSEAVKGVKCTLIFLEGGHFRWHFSSLDIFTN